MPELQIIERQVTEQKIDGQRLGRHVKHDSRSREYQAGTANSIVSVVHESIGLPFDQGSIGSCTANALCGALNSQPYTYRHGPFTERGAVNLYKRETADEGQPYPPNDPGGSGLAVCQAAREMGWISSYAHAFGLDQALAALVLRPVIFGVDWYSSFDQPNAAGLVEITAAATVRGGHEVVATEIDAPGELVWFYNSWGPSYGVRGRFCMSFETLAQLLSSQGDATVPYV